LEKPLIDINHIHAHAYGALMSNDADERTLPAVGLIVSGGHTSLFHCRTPLAMDLIGKTRDDAAGEAFDKVATVLGLPYPGGPVIDRLARQGDPEAIKFPRTWLGPESFDFSFSGIKTAVLYHVRGAKLSKPDSSHLSDQQRADIAASFQTAVVEVLVEKAIRACRARQVQTLLVGGGVAANSYLRDRLSTRCRDEAIRLLLADRKMCTDNAAMVAGLAWHKYKAGRFADLSEAVRST
jgi:N6-L-threonylcarbamoyladenine synthase